MLLYTKIGMSLGSILQIGTLKTLLIYFFNIVIHASSKRQEQNKMELTSTALKQSMIEDLVLI